MTNPASRAGAGNNAGGPPPAGAGNNPGGGPPPAGAGNNPGGGGPPPARGSSAETFFGGGTSQVDDRIAIERDGTVRVFSGKVELGTGVRTALAQIVAEELDVPFERVQLVMGDTALTPDEGYTAGSQTIKAGGSALRSAAAEARSALMQMASDRLDAAPDELSVRDGVITVRHHPDRAVSYAELMGGQKFGRAVSGQAPLKRPQEYRIVGTSVQRVDLPAKLTGKQSFVQDVRLAGMLHARVVRPPSPGAVFVSLDESSVRAVPLVKLVQRGNYVAVVTAREEDAVRAARQLKVEWRESESLPRMAELYDVLRTQVVQDATLVAEGDAQAALEQASRTLHATYYQPYHSHASLGPSCAVADVQPDSATVWSNTQGPNPLRGALAQLLELPPDKVRLVHIEGSGCYGANGSDDVAADAAFLSQVVGQPVRVQWSRAEEFIWEPKGAAMVMDVRGALDASGNIVAWDYQVWSPTHVGRPRMGRQLLTALLLNQEPPPPARFFLGGEFNASVGYDIPNRHARIQWLANSAMRVSSFRSLGGAANSFATESFIDELAAAAGADPLEFRLRHLHDERARAVLHAVAARAGWQADSDVSSSDHGIGAATPGRADDPTPSSSRQAASNVRVAAQDDLTRSTSGQPASNNRADAQDNVAPSADSQAASNVRAAAQDDVTPSAGQQSASNVGAAAQEDVTPPNSGQTRPSPRGRQTGIAEGRGLAYVQYNGEGAYVACVAYVQVDTATGVVRVQRIIAAHDCGLIINPDGATNQIEGNIIQALSRALKEEVTFDQTRITSVDWQTYPILTFSELPQIDVILLDRPNEPAIGAGEAATVTTAAAVANAIFDATGARVRQIPLTPQRVREAILEQSAAR